jgi:hypothetical protein
MASLQDQLLKAGLVDEKKAKKVKQAQRKQKKVALKNNQSLESEAAKAAKQAAIDNAESSRQLNKQKEAEAEKKAIAAQIKQLIQNNKLKRNRADLAYNFEFNNSFKKIYVLAEQQNLLSRGKLAIVHLQDAAEESFEVVPSIIAEKIAERDPANVILIHDNGSKDQQNTCSEEEEWYADYEIPDDLMW